MPTIDINCDVGEGVNNEASLMPYISSCNIACGAHAGNIETIDRVIYLAIQHGVKIGAHPSFPDRENFGRKAIDISIKDLELSVIDQIQLLQQQLQLQGGQLHHIKAHGALYNISAKDPKYAEVVIRSLQKTAPDVELYVPFNSEIERMAIQEKIRIKYEVFADRNYNEDLSLVSRSNKNAVIINKEKVIEHISNMILNQKVKTISNAQVSIIAETCCVHGDNETAIDIVKYIHESLKGKGITIA